MNCLRMLLDLVEMEIRGAEEESNLKQWFKVKVEDEEGITVQRVKPEKTSKVALKCLLQLRADS